MERDGKQLWIGEVTGKTDRQTEKMCRLIGKIYLQWVNEYYESNNETRGEGASVARY